MKRFSGVILGALMATAAMAQSYSSQISTSCVGSCKTTVQLNGMEREYQGVSKAKFIADYTYLEIKRGHQTRFINWHADTELSLEEFKLDCPSCADSYLDYKSINPKLRYVCENEFRGSALDQCFEIAKTSQDPEKTAYNINACEEVLTFSEETLKCTRLLEPVDIRGIKKVIDDCNDAFPFGDDALTCLEGIVAKKFSARKLRSCKRKFTFSDDVKKCLNQ
ncbi:MAG: hypothetical protein CME62_08430 [Halobacteriovoraceae bacterium]|nr:hypothetical protein [Halobacteriovoraceae bacterium]|tara:strand:+ start:153 stop:818 length:666 start_codon:yes stop_codon:yes gene_type:complete